MIHVAINGYGTIGRRVADAISLQDDMNVVGISKSSPDYMSMLGSKKFRLFVTDKSKTEKFESAGIHVEGTVEDMISDCDVVVDCSPGGIGEKNMEIYKKHGKRAVFQGGEEASLVDASFNSYANYDAARDKKYIRVVSCNTTGMARTLSVLRDEYGINGVTATLVRRATDQNDSKKGPINAIEPSLSFPSHHAPDLVSVLGEHPIETVAFKVPTTLMHVHSLFVDLKEKAEPAEIIKKWSAKRRILLVSGKDGRSSTAQLMDYARELGRPRGDLYEIAVWKESVRTTKTGINYIQAVHQESDVVPENVDAIRSMFALSEREDSIYKTDHSLSIIGGR